MLRADIVNGLLAMGGKLVERAESANARDWLALAGFVAMTLALYDTLRTNPSAVPTTAEQNMANHASEHLRGTIFKVFNSLEKTNLGEAMALCTESLRIFNNEISGQKRLTDLIEYKKLRAQLHFLRAQVFYLQNGFQEAAAELKRAVGYYKEYTPALNFLAHLYINHLNDLHQAKEYLLLSNTEKQKQLFVDFYRALEADQQEDLGIYAETLINQYIAYYANRFDDSVEEKLETSLHRLVAPALLLKWMERTARYETNAVKLNVLIDKIELVLKNHYMMEFDAARVLMKEMQLIAYQRIAELKSLRHFDITDDKALREKCLSIHKVAVAIQDVSDGEQGTQYGRNSQEVAAITRYFVPLNTDRLDRDAKAFNEMQLQQMKQVLETSELDNMARMIRCCLEHQYLDVRGNEELGRAKTLLDELRLSSEDADAKQSEILRLCGSVSAIQFMFENHLNPKNGWKPWLQPLHAGRQTMSFLHVACLMGSANVDVYECLAGSGNELTLLSSTPANVHTPQTLSLLYFPENDTYQVLREITSPAQLANELAAHVAWDILNEDGNHLRASTFLADKGCDLPPRREVEMPYVPAARRSLFVPIAVGSVIAAGAISAYIYTKHQ